MRRVIATLVIAIGIGFLSTIALATPVVVGTSTGANAFPFSYYTSFGATEYQQVYSSSAFSSSGLINEISFYAAHSGSITTADYSIYLSTTSAGVNGLSSIMVSNVGADNTLFFNGQLGGWVSQSTPFTISGTGFDYNPVNGNLLLTMFISNEQNDGSASFYSDETATVTSRMVNGSVSGLDLGLITGFNQVPVPVATPEPSTIFLLGAGLAGFCLVRSRAKN